MPQPRLSTTYWVAACTTSGGSSSKDRLVAKSAISRVMLSTCVSLCHRGGGRHERDGAIIRAGLGGRIRVNRRSGEVAKADRGQVFRDPGSHPPGAGLLTFAPRCKPV